MIAMITDTLGTPTKPVSHHNLPYIKGKEVARAVCMYVCAHMHKMSFFNLHV